MRTDWIYDDNYDEKLDANGDYIEDSSAQQEAEEAIDTVKGQLSQFPASGLGAINYVRKVNGTTTIADPVQFKRDAKIELEADGHVNPDIVVSNNADDFYFDLGVQP